jgi:hypothetical protein
MNKLRDEIHQVMEDKGFHAVEYTHKEALIFRQLCHLAIEWGEAWETFLMLRPVEHAGHRARAIEELADIMIVAYDLAGMAGVDMTDDPYPAGPAPEAMILLIRSIAYACDEYRKHKTLEGLRHVVAYAAETIAAWGGDPAQAVARKMEINRLRPAGYGVAR